MMMRASASGIEEEETMGFDGGAVGSDPEAAGLSPADPKVIIRPSNRNDWKFLIARLLMVKVLDGRKLYVKINGLSNGKKQPPTCNLCGSLS
jgi:hypothetical protein